MSFRLGRVKVTFSYYSVAAFAAAVLTCRSSLFICGVLSAAVHELGHLAAIMTACGVTVREIAVSPTGVRIKADGCTVRPLILAAGAGANILLGAAAFITWSVRPDCRPAAELTAVNICLALCNLLPIEPLDGGLLMRCALEKRILPDDADRVMLAVSICLLCPLAAAALLTAIRSNGNVSLLALCLWLIAGIVRRYI